MEVLSGRQAVFNGPKSTYLRDLFWNEMDKNGTEPLLQIVDSKAKNWPVDVAHQLLNISFEATSLRAKRRPTFEMLRITFWKHAGFHFWSTSDLVDYCGPAWDFVLFNKLMNEGSH
ncbi:unnamed protein product [Ranitomeya imitator]|uniref:Uncharacterized protein n=1 Tax=Ranitomeya imitator TaxID=111125 RepID=A0ABN9MH63_9NEOB|nr:unnamed protein product [Ranitomeya imitator]